MKYYKIYFALVIGCLFSLMSCEDDENLNLSTFPDNGGSAIISETEGNSELILNATYNEDGILVVDGQVTRTYTFTFKPSPEDIIVSYDLLTKNIPAEIVRISKLVDTIPAGYSESSVEVILQDDDFSFAQTNYDEEIYELGVKATAKGYKISTDTIEAKVSIKKEAYIPSYSFLGEKGSSTSFERVYSNGQILNEDAISYSFKIIMDKPLLKETKLELSVEGLSDKFLSTVTWSTTEVIIPAGEKSSEVITWSIKDDFLMETDEEETHSIKLTATSEDISTLADSANGFASLTINKVLRNFKYVTDKDASWIELPKTDWGGTAISSLTGKVNNLFDGRGGQSGSSIYTTRTSISFMLDLASEQSFKRIGFDYYRNSSASAPRIIKISTSLDNEKWITEGELVELPQSYSQYFEFFNETKARYIKFEMSEKHNNYIEPTEIYIYK